MGMVFVDSGCLQADTETGGRGDAGMGGRAVLYLRVTLPASPRLPLPVSVPQWLDMANRLPASPRLPFPVSAGERLR